MDGGAWWATVHGVARSRTRLSDFTTLSLGEESMFVPEVVIEEGSRDPAGRRAKVAYSEIWDLKSIFKEHSF